MRQSIVAALLLLLLVTPVRAEGEHVLVDLRARILPGEADGHCFYVDEGAITLEAATVGDNQWPVQFVLSRPVNSPSSMILDIGTAPITASQRFEAGLWCYALIHKAPAPGGEMRPDTFRRWEQAVDVRLTWTP